MRLTLAALLCAAVLASPALAHGDRPSAPPPGADFAPPPPPPGYWTHGGPVDPRWERSHGDWLERCHRHPADDRDRHDRASGYADDCPPPMPHGYGYPGAYPGAYMSYGVPMIMVPVLRSKPCKEVVEVIEEVVPVRRRAIRPRARVVPDKRVPMNDKRIPVTPSKRIAY